MQLDWKKLFLTADGRIGRQEFWIGYAILFALWFIGGMIPGLNLVIGFILLWPNICITAKRLHDMGKTAWLMLIPGGVAFLCVIVGLMVGGMAMIGAGAMNGDAAAAGAGLAGVGMIMGFMGIAILVALGFLLWVGLTPSQPGENRFGPPPAPAVPAV